MKIIAETPRLILREFIDQDAQGLFELDSNPKVLKYIGTPPLKSIEEIYPIIERVKKEYEAHGVGRVAVLLKETNEFLGWAGLKYITQSINNRTNYYDLGYRFLESQWGKGYASEAAKATFDYGFDVLKLKKIYAITDAEHIVSQHVLKKTGFSFVEEFYFEEDLCHWFEAGE